MRTKCVAVWCIVALVLLTGCQGAPGSPTPAVNGGPTPALTRALVSPTPASATAPTLTPPSGNTTLAPADPAPAETEGAYVVVYSDTARTESAMAALMEQHPGLEAETYTLSSLDTYLQMLDDLQHGQPRAHLYLVSDAPRTLALAAEGILQNELPEHLIPALAPEDREPLLTHHWTALTWVASAPLAPDAGLDNWWALTTTAWRGRVVLPDPTIDERTLILLATAAQQDEAFRDAYRQQFGREIELDSDCPTAGYQWVKSLFSNQVHLTLSDAEVLAALAQAETDQPLVGLCGSEQWEKATRESLALQPLLEMAPAAGLMWRSYLAMVTGNQDPAAAREAIEWLMGDASGGGGAAVWYKAGFYPTRQDVPDPPGAPPRAELAARLWSIDLVGLDAHLGPVRDLVAPYVGHPVGGR